MEMRQLLFYLGLLAAVVLAPVFAVWSLFDDAPVSVTTAAVAQPAPDPSVSAQEPNRPRTPVWIVPTREYKYTPPPITTQSATRREMPDAKEQQSSKKKKNLEAQRPQPTAQALSSFAQELPPPAAPSVLNRD